LTKYIALNNILAVSPQDNPFVTQRIFHSVPRPTKGDPPFSSQVVTLTQNAYSVDLLAHKYSGVANSTAAKLDTAKVPLIDPKFTTLSVLNAAANVENETGSQAIKTLLPLLEKRPYDIGLLLTIIQLYILTNNSATATSLLESFLKKLDEASDDKSRSARYAPGLVSLTVSLYTLQHRSASAKEALVEAAKYWKSKSSSSSSASLLLRAAGTSVVLDPNSTKEDAKTASAIFKDLHAANKSDGLAAAGLIAAQCLADGPSAQIDKSLLKFLPPIEKQIGKVDIAALENAGIYSPPPPESSTGKRKKRTDEEEAKKKEQKAAAAGQKKRKLSAKRMPKDYVEGKSVDAERWLPMRDRSYWRPKGKKGKARAAGLTQGGAVEDKPEPKAAAPVVTGGGPAKNKKKKAGKKW
jgi:signal recognition particle subunit SRP72